MPADLPDTDAVNFSLALERFELARHQPHFPGYPLYVLVTRGLWALGIDAVWALALPGALASAGLLAVIAAVSVGAITLRLAEANDEIMHLLSWHYLPSIFFASLGALLGRYLLRW